MPFTEIIIPIFALIFTGAFTALWLRDTSRVYLLGIIAAYATLFASWTLDIIFFNDPSALRSTIMHVASASGVAALGWGLCKRSGGRAPLAAMALVVILSTPLYYVAAQRENIEALIATSSLATALLFLMGGMALWATKPTHPLEKSALVLIGTLVTIYMVDPVYRLIAIEEDVALVSDGSIYVMVDLASMVIIPVLFAIVVLGLCMLDEWQRLQAIARCDKLSGLLARAAFEEDASFALSRAHMTGVPFSLIVGDIDHFKAVNDTFGHSVGDKVISAFGSKIAEQIRSSDMAGRVGGEEFCVGVWNCREKPAQRLADRIRQSVEEMTASGAQKLPATTASFGIAEAQDGETYASLFKRADTALYAAKNAGRNRAVIATDAEQSADEGPADFAGQHEHNSRVVPLRRVEAGT